MGHRSSTSTDSWGSEGGKEREQQMVMFPCKRPAIGSVTNRRQGKVSPRSFPRSSFGEERRPDPRERRKSSLTPSERPALLVWNLEPLILLLLRVAKIKLPLQPLQTHGHWLQCRSSDIRLATALWTSSLSQFSPANDDALRRDLTSRRVFWICLLFTYEPLPVPRGHWFVRQSGLTCFWSCACALCSAKYAMSPSTLRTSSGDTPLVTATARVNIHIVNHQIRATITCVPKAQGNPPPSLSVNPFTPESDQCQISPAASPEILHHTVRRTWLFIAYSDERWL